ncbi:ATP-dependent DNA ligase [Streptomyces albidoflavus]|uniref:ATP-dependent DNA ligase n=1 Tax=Streptomyces albidoflavus TaxID=1886 RepID=UPI0020BFFCF2|nr:ATP-dependent DNA ligase [Streptomyces albidoflavus]MCL6281726.1 ATP-dependent DNA ligase [Streptomyces albidoflavus]
MLKPPIAPMRAEARASLPAAGAPASLYWQQKLDGYRVVAFLRGGRLHLQSRTGADLTAHFPELQAAAGIGMDLVLDGELVVLRDGRLDFAALQQRARLAGFRARTASQSTPAHVVAFDLLEADGEVLTGRPYRERWARLEALFTGGVLSGRWALVGSTTDRDRALAWMDPDWARAGVEGVVVKAAGGRYRPGKGGWWKVRSRESTEGVVGAVTGPLSAPDTLLLGRWDAEARFRMIARTTPLPATARREVGAVLTAAGDDHPWHGVTFSAGWGTRTPLPHVPVEPALVAEVTADTSVDDAGRYRHPVRFLRLRDDIGPDSVPPLP